MDDMAMAKRAEAAYRAPSSEVPRIVGCEFKHRYHSLESATRWAYLNEERYGTVAEPYRCRFCNGWHLATKHSKE